MKRWWQRRTLKLRLAFWYAAATALVLMAFVWFNYEVIEHRLAAEIDRQLRIDFDLVEGQLGTAPDGRISWAVRGSHGDEGLAGMSAWFEVWSEDRQLLLRHWPVPESQIKNVPPAPEASTLRFHTMELERLFLRVMERPARLQGRPVVIRLYRDETEMRRTLREIIEVSTLGMPLAVVLAAIGGYLIAGRSLAPLAAMSDQARKITSESLSERLPNPNPHDELGRLASVFNDTLARLENSFAELKRFTADASHELRSPLTALRAVGEVALRDGIDPAALRDTIGSMLEEAQRLDDLVDALLTLARMEHGEIAVDREPLAVHDLLVEVREQLAVLATEKRQSISIDCTVGLRVTADRLLLRQAVMNIVHNAIRYSPADKRVTLRATGGESIIIEVADEGPGLASEQREKIFERFYRIDKARSRAEGGAGLGLAIAKSCVERQGGRIEIQSQPGSGSIFRLVFPGRAA